MKKRIPDSSHTFPLSPAVPTQWKKSAHLRKVFAVLEQALARSEQGGMLLILDEDMIVSLALMGIEHLLHQNPHQHLLWLVKRHQKAVCLKAWEQAQAWGDGSPLRDRFTMTPLPQKASEAQVCIAAVTDIQLAVDITPRHPFFLTLDAVLCSEVLDHPGPALTHMLEIFCSLEKRVIGLGATILEDVDASLFPRIIDTKSQTT
ncbi:hypothetical protein [Ktedonospora formicarum]|uniref:Uncharacterized protein n=1 Tax=Ktedonospora formicarum TaxID=2778364 RepID=A0A8J3IEF6_9CHLR|nr:hypothetical protein [Ktedonospora formicarum]GHO50853.1 hypothetical protein KSX_90160 [Ktedonospora formicarum]